MKMMALLALLLSVADGDFHTQPSTEALCVIARESSFLNDARAYEAKFKTGAYSIRRDGLIRRLSADGPDIEHTLSLDTHDRIYTLFALTVDHDLLVFYEASDELENTGAVARLDGRTLALKWVASGAYMNIATPVICGDSLCVAGHGTVTRLVLATGRIVWSHSDLYDQFHAFNTPEGLVVDGGNLIVHETLASYDHRPSMTMVVDLKSGKYTVK